MNYIVFDLEWNQCPYGKNRENKALPFEIIEIGAVKLDSRKNVISKFYKVVKPKVYTVLHYRTRDIVHLSKKEMNNGEPFADAASEFLRWAGSDGIFCTWGSTDLIELQRNMEFYHMLDLLKGPLHYLDVQKLFAIQHESMRKKRALEYAADFLDLEKSQEFHNALSDAEYTAEVLKTIDDSVIWAYDSIDVYQNPKTKQDEIHTLYNGYSKYISRAFPDKEKAMADDEVSSTYCCVCGKKARKKIRWFSVNSKNYYCVAYCNEHGYLKGKIRMLHASSGDVFVEKKIKVSAEIEAEEVAKKKAEIRLKRKKH